MTFGNRTVPVQWHIIPQKCEPILAGRSAEQLGIIKFSAKPKVLYPVNMIQHLDKKHVFRGIGKLNDYEVKIYCDQTVKPIAEPARTIPYHLQERV